MISNKVRLKNLQKYQNILKYFLNNIGFKNLKIFQQILHKVQDNGHFNFVQHLDGFKHQQKLKI